MSTKAEKAKRLKMATKDVTDENIERLAELFPNCLTEAKDERGRTVKAIDFDKLRQELSHDIVEGPEERYQFNWPEKRKAMRTANMPTTMTLRPCRDESVNFDTTQNLYIEGDNLEVLKLLRENYLHSVKMIYIDPPYNTGKDSFVYDDDFRKSEGDFADESGAIDEEGNRQFDLRQNNESNGRFHTDWLNMMYPRLKVAKDLLANDGVIFISIDDNEVENLRRLCNEIFGESNFVNQFVWKRNSSGKTERDKFTVNSEYVLLYRKSLNCILNAAYKPLAEATIALYKKDDGDGRGPYRLYPLQKPASPGPETTYDYTDNNGKVWKCPPKGWRIRYEKMKALENDGRLCLENDTLSEKAYWNERANEGKRIDTLWIDLPENTAATREVMALFGGKTVFTNPKPTELIKRCLQISFDDSFVLDFFSGSATAAHAVMKLNAEDGGKRKFIMVQLPEPCDEKSEAFKAGYRNICEIGKERIRRAGKKVVEEFLATKNAKGAKEDAQEEGDLFRQDSQNLQDFGKDNPVNPVNPVKNAPPDVGFRVLKLDTSNMEDVYYSPKAFAEKAIQGALNLDGDMSLAENIKPGRTGEDLLFQAMLQLDVPLSAKIETEEIHGKKVFVVEDGYMMATFDKDVNEEAISAIAKRKPSVFVMCDGGFATDNVADNFEQIWKEYSPETVRRVI